MMPVNGNIIQLTVIMFIFQVNIKEGVYLMMSLLVHGILLKNS